MAEWTPSRASPLPQLDWVWSVGEWLACELSSLVGQLPQAGRYWSAVGPSSRAGSLLQVDGMQSERDELAGRSSSRAGSLPQLDWVWSVGGGLAVRASSLASQLPQGVVGLAGLLAEDDDAAG